MDGGVLAIGASAVSDKTTEFRAGRRQALAIVASQLSITLLVTLASGYLGGSVAAWSALAGGGIGTLAGLYMALNCFRKRPDTDPDRIARRFYSGEFVKLSLTVVLFALVLVFSEPRIGPLLGAYAATFFAYWMALARGVDPEAGQEV
jgi:ATP synthase protein I